MVSPQTEWRQRRFLHRHSAILKLREHFVCVCTQFYLGHSFFYIALLVNDKGGTHHTHRAFAVQFLFLLDAVYLDGGQVRIRKQDKGQTIFFSKLAMGGGAIAADSDHFRPFFEIRHKARQKRGPVWYSRACCLWDRNIKLPFSRKVG